MPLDTKNETSFTCVLDRLYHAIVSPCDRAKIASRASDRLMMMRIHGCGLPCQFKKQILLSDAHRVRMTIERLALSMFHRSLDLRLDILNETASTRNVQYLHSKTDREYRQFKSLGLFENKQVGLILLRNDSS